jgi:fermentation-respiration switch protein FrsA (DUF1100 family)
LFKRIFRKKALIKILAFYIFIVALMYIFQRNFLYYPFGKILIIPEDFQEVNLKTLDNTSIYGWYSPPQKGQKTILYFHGNAGNLMGRSDRFEKFATQYGVMAISYRGYAKSKGEPSQDGFFQDADSAFEFLKSKNISSKDIILFGESIGSAVAVNLASKHDFGALILEAPFSSILSMAQKSYWFLPVSLILKDRFEVDKIAPEVTAPVLVMHAKKDYIVPFEEGEKLYSLFNSRKKLIAIDGDFHIALTGDYLMKQILEFLQEKK